MLTITNTDETLHSFNFPAFDLYAKLICWSYKDLEEKSIEINTFSERGL